MQKKGEEMAQIKIGDQMVEYTIMFPLQTNSGDAIYKYKGNSGLCYKYDLSNPIDRQRYEMDFLAQSSDIIKTVNIKVSSDRGINQYGGGIQ